MTADLKRSAIGPPSSRPVHCAVCKRGLGTELTYPLGGIFAYSETEWKDDNHWDYVLYPIGFEPRCAVPCSGPDGQDERIIARAERLRLRATGDYHLAARGRFHELLRSLGEPR
jgi:hypothetical protein